MNINN